MQISTASTEEKSLRNNVLEYNMFSTVVDPKKTTWDIGMLVLDANFTLNNEIMISWSQDLKYPINIMLPPSCYYYTCFGELVPLSGVFFLPSFLPSLSISCGSRAHFITAEPGKPHCSASSVWAVRTLFLHNLPLENRIRCCQPMFSSWPRVCSNHCVWAIKALMLLPPSLKTKEAF